MSKPKPRVLLCDDEPNLRKVLGALLQQEGFEVHAEADGESALSRLRAAPSGTFDAVISDLRMPKLDGLGVLRAIAREDPKLPVILLTAYGSVDSAVEAVKLGAFDYLEKPFDREQIRAVLRKALATRERGGASVGSVRASDELRPADTGVTHPAGVGMVGSSPAIQEVSEIVLRVAASPSTVLITGESGTGKELVAHALHLHSSRRSGPFIRVNCAAIPAGLTESELFGHERGAFTGAVSSRAGRFELAHGGTLFLDEVSEIPLEIQVKLLRAIQESEFERVGGVKTIHVDVRLVAATNRDLEADIRERRFREDLYYRLAVVPIRLPPLRERLADVPDLVVHFLARCNQRLSKNVRGFTPSALEALSHHTWPGNIRELENLVERVVLFASGDEIDTEDLPDAFSHTAIRRDGQSRPTSETTRSIREAEEPRHIRLPLSSLGFDLKEAVRAGSRLVEEALIREALTQTAGNVTRSARMLGISRRSLQSKMKELALRPPNEDESKPQGQ